ncbi:MAG: hypothetical protein KJ048_00130 [Dehalococcoidia bacterium]|nr:hypothetical protein [Dehalococcoidia bacterium]
MAERDDLLQSIATTIADYRDGEIDRPTPEHVDRWVSQFDRAVRVPILRELNHVLDKTYITRDNVSEFLAKLVVHERLTGGQAADFWRGIRVLDIQQGGSSQHDLLTLFDQRLRDECGLAVESCGETPSAYVYLDDGIFTGNRLKNDVTGWLAGLPPGPAKLVVIVIAWHEGGRYYAETEIKKAAAARGVDLAVDWWRCLAIEDRKAYINACDVLRPRELLDDPLARGYVAALTYQPVYRTAAGVGPAGFFTDEEGRALLEREFLTAGLRIREQSPHLNEYQRPLGNMVLQSLGFGSLLVTYRNCPNNAPLALWAGDPWYPLFPRRTNVRPVDEGFDLSAFLDDL